MEMNAIYQKYNVFFTNKVSNSVINNKYVVPFITYAQGVPLLLWSTSHISKIPMANEVIRKITMG